MHGKNIKNAQNISINIALCQMIRCVYVCEINYLNQPPPVPQAHHYNPKSETNPTELSRGSQSEDIRYNTIQYTK